MTATDPGAAAARSRWPFVPSPLELPIEPVPERIEMRTEVAELVDAADAAALVDVIDVADTVAVVDVADVTDVAEPVVAPEPEPEPEPEPPRLTVVEPADIARDEIERNEAGPGTLRPVVPEPASPVTRSVVVVVGPPDRLHPVRAAFGLIALVAFAGLGLAVAIGMAIAAVALAVKGAAGG